jgi:RimJ/RimL family protein N-acetyltransferase
MVDVLLREVEPGDVAVFYEQQADADASRLAAVASRDRTAHAAHWAKIMADPEVVIRTIVVEGAVAGQVLSFPREGVREVGYWLGRQYWGRGLASAALAEFLSVDRQRPLHGVVAEHNVASRRVLERSGFVLVGREEPNPDLPPDLAVPLLVLRLDSPPSATGTQSTI